MADPSSPGAPLSYFEMGGRDMRPPVLTWLAVGMVAWGLLYLVLAGCLMLVIAVVAGLPIGVPGGLLIVSGWLLLLLSNGAPRLAIWILWISFGAGILWLFVLIAISQIVESITHGGLSSVENVLTYAYLPWVVLTLIFSAYADQYLRRPEVRERFGNG